MPITWLQTIIIGIVEGLTEFLPISSTGHMIIAQQLLGIPDSEFMKAFIVSIQLGAILSVVVLYWKKFLQSLAFYYKLAIAFVPAGVFGLLFNKKIDMLLGGTLGVTVVASTLLIGGIVLLFVDKWFSKEYPDQEITFKKALSIGFFQVLAMIPGMSRSAATIVGGMSQKLTRKNAAEFSFFLAVPTMFAATAWKLLKSYHEFNAGNIKFLLVGNIVAFVVAMIAIKTFISILTKYGFKAFGYYRIILGIILLVLIACGVNLSLS